MTSIQQQRGPRQVVVDHGDGTVSLLMDAKFLECVDGVVRIRRVGDTFRNLVIPREEASGTARKAPSTLWEREPEARTAPGSVVGIKSAPPQSGLILGAMGFGS